jgi:hypothetical protein
MRRRTVGERAMFVCAVLGIVLGAAFLFAPIQGFCTSSASATAMPPDATPGPPATFSPQVCGTEALWQRQPIFPLPFFAVLVWSLAPLLSYYGVRIRGSGDAGVGTLIVVIGLVLEATTLISFGAAPFFVPFVFLPLLIATVLAFATPRMG